MRIASLTYSYYPLYGGAEIQARLLAKAFRSFGHHVTVITMHFAGTQAAEIVEGTTVIRVPGRVIEWGETIGTLQAVVAAFLQLRRLRPRVDILQLHGPSVFLMSAVICKKLYGAPVVVKMIATPTALQSKMMTSSRLSWFNWLKRWFANHVDCFVCLNDEVVAEVKAFAPRARLVQIPNGVDCERWLRPNAPAGHQGTTGIYVGRLTAGKGVDVLLRVWKEVVQRMPAARLFVVGDGPLSAEMHRLASQLGISESVEFTGPQEDVRESMFRADVFLLFSANEGMSNALLEAMAAGVPVVCNDNPGTSALIEHMVNGIRIKVDRIADAAGHVCQVLEDKALARKLAERAQADVRKRFDISVTARQYDQLFMDLLKGTKTH